ncbi:hypothetical protein C4J81_01350 [Deltaproteobacteria bacterium Smac51]|nr:hypothetical protein C4J81_01350 [Deltaproteobacteria bacterium Smac51]
MVKTQKDPREGHRKRLRQKYIDHGISKLTDAEILELLLTFGTPRSDCKLTARAMLDKFGTLRDVFEADPKLLAEVDGAGPNNILAVKIINDIAGVFLERRLLERQFLFGSEQIMSYLRQSMENLPKEVFKVIFLDNSNVVISVDELSEGTITGAYVHTRTFLEKSVKYNSTYMVMVHNHPSGKVEPSLDDQSLTRKLVHVAYMSEMLVLDHLIIGKGGEYFSFRDKGLISLYEGEVRETYKSPPLATGGLLHESFPLTYTKVKLKSRKTRKTPPATKADLEREGRMVHEPQAVSEDKD